MTGISEAGAISFGYEFDGTNILNT